MQALYLTQRKRKQLPSSTTSTADHGATKPNTTHRVRAAHRSKPPRFGPSLSKPTNLPPAGATRKYLKAYDQAFFGEAHHSAKDPKSK